MGSENQPGPSFPLSERPVLATGGHLDIGVKRTGGQPGQLGWYREHGLVPSRGRAFLLGKAGGGPVIEPIRPETASVTILDQRALPDAIRYWRCTSADDVVQAIQTLAVRGAPAIGIAGLYALWLEAESLRGRDDFWTVLGEAKDRVRGARPTAVNLQWAVDRVWKTVRDCNPEQVPSLLRQAADQLAQEEQGRNTRMAEWGVQTLTPGSRVLTHCNTGSLATVGMGTALGVIREGFRQGLVDRVWVDETRPLLQGARLTAWELLQDDIPATLITDNAAASLMAQGLVDVVLVGADRICANGDTANKIGTYSLAVLAHYHHIPFYVVAPLSTMDLTLDQGDQIPIEERNHDEVRTVRGSVVAPQEVSVFNPAFDVTPEYLVSGIITDVGVLHQPYRTSISALVDGA